MQQFIRNIALGKLFFIMLVTVPVTAGFVYALLYSLGIVGALSDGFTTAIWEIVFTSKLFWSSFAFSIYVALVSVGLSLIIAISTAISWHKNLSSGVLGVAVYLPLCFPGTVMAFFMFQLASKSGLLSRLGFSAGLINDIAEFPTLINDAYGIGIILTSILLITPFFIILFSNLYQSEKIAQFKNLALTFGATKKQLLFKITLPILLKKASVTIYLFIIFVMGSYEVPLLLGRQYPQMISVAILQKIQRFNLNDIPQGYAMSVLYFMVIIVLLTFLFKSNSMFFNKKVKS